jgi:hypothetical protein
MIPPSLSGLIDECLNRRCPDLRQAVRQLLRSLEDACEDPRLDPRVCHGMKDDIGELVARSENQCCDETLALLPHLSSLESMAAGGEPISPQLAGRISMLIRKQIFDNSTLIAAIRRIRLLASAIDHDSETSLFDDQITRIERETAAVVHLQHEILFPRILSQLARASHRRSRHHDGAA